MPRTLADLLHNHPPYLDAHWEMLRVDCLRKLTNELVGPAREEVSLREETGFRACYLPNGEIIVTLTDTCDLGTVYDTCHRIIDALHHGDDDFLDFTRDPTEADTRIRTFEQGHPGT